MVANFTMGGDHDDHEPFVARIQHAVLIQVFTSSRKLDSHVPYLLLESLRITPTYARIIQLLATAGCPLPQCLIEAFEL